METMDSLMNDLQQELFEVMLSPGWSFGVAPAVDLCLLGRFYERYADHAVAVAQRVVFVVTAENVGSHSPPAGHPPPS
jgi:phosphate transport system protein